MSTVIFVDSSGASQEVDVQIGQTIMEAARDAGIDSITADCGGACACATCHVYIDEAWLPMLPEVEAGENDMLDFTTAPREKGSRLSCQLVMKEEYAGMKIYTPPADQ